MPKHSSPFTNLIQNQDRGGLIYPSKKFVEALCVIQDFVTTAAPNLIGYSHTAVIFCKVLKKKLDNSIFDCPLDTSHFSIVWETICKHFVPLLLKNYASTITENQAKQKAMFKMPLNRKILKLS